MAADRRIDAAGGAGQFGEQRAVERFAHAVEALELETLDAAGVLDHAGDGERIVGGELRIEPPARRQQFFHAGHVAEVGHRLAGEYRIIGKPALLRALDLRVPIGALDQPHGQPRTERGGRLLDPRNHRQRALLIGLHGKAEALPAAQRRVGERGADHLERQLQPIRLLGIDGELQVVCLGKPRERDETRRQLGQDPRARDRFEARMQRRQLD